MNRITDKFESIAVFGVVVYMCRNVKVCVPCSRDFTVAVDRASIFPHARFETDNLAINNEPKNRTFAFGPNLDSPPNDMTAPRRFSIPSEKST
jgi:hypothetical protein